MNKTVFALWLSLVLSLAQGQTVTGSKVLQTASPAIGVKAERLKRIDALL